MDNITLIQGDCLEEMQKLIEENIKVDLILTDPPYGTTTCKWDNIIPFKEMWDCINQLSNSTAPTLLFGTEPFSSHLRLSNLKNYKYDWIWNKEYAPGIFLGKHQPLNEYEIISVFYRKAGQYNPIMEKAEKLKSSFSRKNTTTNIYGNSNVDVKWEDTGLRYPKRTLYFNSQKGECNNINRVHPTQKPVDLLEYLIKTYTNEGDLVLDFTMGSGSTGVACQNLNRKFIGIELDENYYNIAKERIKNNNQTRLI